MKPIKKLQLTILATVLAMSGSCQYLMSTPVEPAKVAAPRKSLFEASKKTALTEAQKTEQASLHPVLRKLSQAGSAFGFENRGILLNQKSVDFAKTKRDVTNKPETESGLNISELKTATEQGNAARNQGRTASNYMSNALRNLVSKDRKITKEVKNSEGKSTGEKRVETWGKDGQLKEVKILAKDGSYRIVDPTGKVRFELTPDGRQITNEYNGTILLKSTEITPNTLNFGNNRTVKVTKFHANGDPKTATFEIGSAITGKTRLEQDFKENNPLEYTLKDVTDSAHPKVLETRTATQNADGTTTLTTRNNKDAVGPDGQSTGKKQITQETVLDAKNNIKSIEIFNKSKESQVDASSTKVSVENGQTTILVTDSKAGPISKITQDGNGLSTVDTVSPTLLGSFSSNANRRTVEVTNGKKGSVTRNSDNKYNQQKKLNSSSKVVQSTPSESKAAQETVTAGDGISTSTPSSVPSSVPSSEPVVNATSDLSVVEPITVASAQIVANTGTGAGAGAGIGAGGGRGLEYGQSGQKSLVGNFLTEPQSSRSLNSGAGEY